MSKPTIFFSHSSKDKEYLSYLKELLIKKTGNTIDIFLSSDGQSIPFGRNWVHNIEESLRLTKIMFVFVSPNSIHSNWIHFEAGFSYSKEKEVIPIGILGFDLNQLTPPLSLLQGFNINSKDGLNNIISTINSKFIYSFDESFTNEEYNELVKRVDVKDSLPFISKYVDYIKLYLYKSVIDDANFRELPLDKNFYDKAIKYFEDNEINFGNYSDQLIAQGLKMCKTNINNNPFELLLDPILVNTNFVILKNLLEIAYGLPQDLEYDEKEIINYDSTIHFNKNVKIITSDFKISSRIHGSKIEISNRSSNLAFEFENIIFSIEDNIKNLSIIESQPILKIVFDINDLYSIPIESLIKELVEKGIVEYLGN